MKKVFKIGKRMDQSHHSPRRNDNLKEITLIRQNGNCVSHGSGKSKNQKYLNRSQDLKLLRKFGIQK